MIFTIMFMVIALVQVGIAITDDDCSPSEDLIEGIRFVNTSVEFVVNYDSEEDEFGLNLVYEWNLLLPKDFEIDGFLYKHIDRSDLSLASNDVVETNVFLPFPMPFKGDLLPNFSGSSSLLQPILPIHSGACDGVKGKTIWTTLANGTSVECKMPCSDFFSHCKTEDICIQLSEDFLPLSKDTNRLMLPAKFGRVFELTLVAYRRWKKIKTFEFYKLPDGREMIKFCNEELISNQGVNQSASKKYCNKTQNIAVDDYPTGPPAGLELFSEEIDLVKNRATAIFRWKDPYDMSFSAIITRYVINVAGGEIAKTAKDSESKHNDSYYYLEVKNVELGKINSIKVTPNLEMNKRCGFQCKHGYPALIEYMIPDINACELENRYCDLNASCEDLPSNNTTSALCSCPIGFSGNGIKHMFPGGTGCIDFDACAEQGNHQICGPNSICRDLSPPSLNVSCSCRAGYYGDGSKYGSGCTKISQVILITTVVPITLCAVIATILFARKIRLANNGKGLSRFIVANNSKYLRPVTTSVCTKNESGAFGEKFEISRECVQLTGVLGRGNFGVVHKAILKLDGETKEVAVKTTAEPHTEEMEREFLAEIALITSMGKHDNVMGIIGCSTVGGSITYLITQFMKYGDLQHFLWDAREESKRKNNSIYYLTERNIYDIGFQVASGLEHLSGLRIIHGDIAARNILVDEGLKCKISDFGLANDVYRYGSIKGAREKRVPLKWISPERMQAGRVPITWRSDVWSFGVLLYESVTLGMAPYSEINQDELYDKLRSGYRMDKPSACSKFLYRIMLQCWEWTPSKRPAFKDLKQLMLMAMNADTPIYGNLCEKVDGCDNA